MDPEFLPEGFRLSGEPPEWMRLVSGHDASWPPWNFDLDGEEYEYVERLARTYDGVCVCFLVERDDEEVIVTILLTKEWKGRVKRCGHESKEGLLSCLLPKGHETSHIGQALDHRLIAGEYAALRMIVVGHEDWNDMPTRERLLEQAGFLL